MRLRTASVLSVSLLLVAFTACGAQTGASKTTAASATATPAGTPTLPTTTISAGACGKYFPDTAPLTPVGGLVVTQYSGLGSLATPSVQIPSNQSAAPILLPGGADTNYYMGNSTPVVNPNLNEGNGGYLLQVCNLSSQAHVISVVQASIARMTSYTDTLQEWHPCDGSYNVAHNSVYGGCGGADVEDEYMHADFAPDAQVGASVTAAQTGSHFGVGYGYGPLPVTLQTGQSLSIEVGVTPPSAPGYYTFAFALTVDGATSGVIAYSPQTLIDTTNAHEWNGKNCETPAMQALIAQTPTPATGNELVICP